MTATVRNARHDDVLATGFVLRDDVRLTDDGDVVTVTGPVTLVLSGVRPAVRAALGRLTHGPVTADSLTSDLTESDRAQLDLVLGRLRRSMALPLLWGDEELLRLEQTALEADLRPVEVTATSVLRLSRFSFCRTRTGVFVLESPMAKFRAVLTHQGTRELVAELGSGHAVADLAGGYLGSVAIGAILKQLVGAGLAEVQSADGFASDNDPLLRQWDFHDLLFHSRIRSGRYDDVFGAAYPYVGQIPPAPAIRPTPRGPAVELHRPRLSDLLARDPSLTTAIESRRSVRQYDDEPITAEQLGEFLYRVARVRGHFRPVHEESGDEVVSRPYPSGGSLYELELYLTVRRCAGLSAGIYHYDPVGHRLLLVNENQADRQSMFHVAARATGLPDRPDVLITMTSRFQRIAWKYRGIAYATTLRNTGVLYQTMYLVATAMGLAPCGLGNGDADLSARVLGLDYLAESSVGDFVLGRRPPIKAVDGPPAPGWSRVNDPEWAVISDR